MRRPHIFQYKGEFDFDATPEKLWTALGRTDHYERWWKWMREVKVEGPVPATGSSVEFDVVAPIPRRMRLKIDVVSALRPESIEAAVSGDLAGTATLRFLPSGNGSTAEVTWSVEVVQRTIRAAAVAMRPVLLWGQDWAVRVALRGFRRHLVEDGS